MSNRNDRNDGTRRRARRNNTTLRRPARAAHQAQQRLVNDAKDDDNDSTRSTAPSSGFWHLFLRVSSALDLVSFNAQNLHKG